MNFFRENLFLIPVLAWIIAVAVKGAYFRYQGKFSIANTL